MNQNFDYTPQNDQQPFGQYNFPQVPQPPKGSSKGFAVASLCLGIASLCLCCACYYLMLPLSILGFIMALLAKRNNGGKMPGMAVAGMILSIVAFVLFVFIIVMEILILAIPEAEWVEIINSYLESTEV